MDISGSKRYIEIKRDIRTIMACSMANFSLPVTIDILSKDDSMGGIGGLGGLSGCRGPRGTGGLVDPGAWVVSEDTAT